jgi:hypothetical protein
VPHDLRLLTVERALRLGATPGQVYEATGIDPWFVDQLLSLVELRAELEAAAPGPLAEPLLRKAKRMGCSDQQLAAVRGVSEQEVRALRQRLRVLPVYKTVDTCAAEFAAETPYHYSSYDEETEVAPVEPPQGAHPRQRAEPHRPGHRVRLRLRARVLRAGRRRLRDRDGQLQPRDRSRPTTTPATGSTSSRSPSRTCSRSSPPSRSRPRRAAASSSACSCSSAGRRRCASRRS